MRFFRFVKKTNPLKQSLKTHSHWKIPNERTLYSSARKGSWNWFKGGIQAVCPSSKNLSNSLGIERGSKILFLAGCYGDWAKALAEDKNQVTYSDVSMEMVKGIKQSSKGKKLKATRILEASQWPRKPNKYDWSISFEPLPLFNQLPLMLMRSLLNQKGAKIIYGGLVGNVGNLRKYYIEGTMRITKRIAELYNASYEKSASLVSSLRWDEMEKITIITLKTSKEARRKAWIDIQVLKAIRPKRKQKKQTITIDSLLKSERIKRLKISKKELIESLNRLDTLSQELDEEHTLNVHAR